MTARRPVARANPQLENQSQRRSTIAASVPPLKLILALVVLGIGMVGLAQVTGANGAQAHPLGTEVLVGYGEGSAGQPGPKSSSA